MKPKLHRKPDSGLDRGPANEGLLFPAFNDRYTDIHSMLYYTKTPPILRGRFPEKYVHLHPYPTGR